MRRSGTVVVLVSMVAAGACQRPPFSATDGAGGTGGSGLSPCASIESRSVTALLPDVLIVLDASGSMNNTIDDTFCSSGCGAISKWAQLTPALDALVAANESTVNWGLKMFADSDAQCGVSNGIAVPVARTNASQIAAAIAARTDMAGGLLNGSRTPTRAAVTVGATYLAGLGDGSSKQILLVTDGTPNCPLAGVDPAADDSAATVQAVADARARGVSTLVVGIATRGGPADQALNDMAVAGGRPRTGAAPAYYPVSNIADLQNVLTPLIATPADCVLALPPSPASTVPPSIGLRANGAEIPFDTEHRDGWDWADTSWTSVRLYGSVCNDFIAGRLEAVTIDFYCDTR